MKKNICFKYLLIVIRIKKMKKYIQKINIIANYNKKEQYLCFQCSRCFELNRQVTQAALFQTKLTLAAIFTANVNPFKVT